ncbi:hypothetical protein NMY22_g16228 [Coprinellus aureogranulatus]|nr:hypothetical protein NMY22_g16228 [Coprinellus aureogranulatus]
MKHRVLNIVVLGGSRVGKTCLISRLVEDELPTFYQTTPKAVSKKVVTAPETVYNCLITDTSGHSTYTPISPQFIIGTHAFILVYSVASRESFDLVKLIHEKLVEFCYPGGMAPLIIVGNKSDLGSAREVSLDEGEALARQLRSPFVETSVHSYQETYKALEMCIGHLEGNLICCQHTQSVSSYLQLSSSLSRAYWSLHNALKASVSSLHWPSVTGITSNLERTDVARGAPRGLPSLPPTQLPLHREDAVDDKPSSSLRQAVAIPSEAAAPPQAADASATLTASEPLRHTQASRAR